MKALEAAARHGADAVYFGVGPFNARANADNIGSDQLPDAIDHLHQRSVKAYLALNILLSDKEIPVALEIVNKAWSAGIDGLIVQDIGFAAQVRKYFPDLPLHASTQMTVTDEAGLTEASKLGFSRVILPRELSQGTIEKLTRHAAELSLETEVFVHGALCISYSGQCLMSSVKAGRSANRGLCSQPCRLNYQCQAVNPDHADSPGEYVSEQPQPMISPRDQALIEYLPLLAAANVKSVKIEGRMRSPEYTALIVSQYRAALDQIAGLNSRFLPDDRQRREKLLLAFNRGGDFTDRYFTGNRNQKPFLTGSYPGSFGIELGRISDVRPMQGLMSIMVSPERLRLPVRSDVLSVRRTGLSAEIASAPIGNIEQQGRLVTVKGFHPEVLYKFKTGDHVYWMTDNASLFELQKSAGHKTLIDLTLNAEPEAATSKAGAGNLNITLNAQIVSGNNSGLTVTMQSVMEQSSGGLQTDRVVKQLKKTGNTPFEVNNVIIKGCSEGVLNVSVAHINQLRRDLIELVMGKMIIRREITEIPEEISADVPAEIADDVSSWGEKSETIENNDKLQIHVCYQKMPHNVSDMTCGADVYILPLWSINHETAKSYVNALKMRENCMVFVWLPPAPQNEISEWMTETISNLAEWDIDGISGGHPGMELLAGKELAYQVDATANITNTSTCLKYLSGKPEALALSSELNSSDQLAVRNHHALSECWNDTRLTVQIYGRQKLMSSIFCPIGKNQPGCKKCHLPETAVNPDASKPYQFIDARRHRLPLQTHPRFCTMDLLDSSIYFDENIISQAAAASAKIALRLDFYDENAEERAGLVSALRNYFQKNESTLPADINRTAEGAAARQNAELIYQRRQIYD